MIRRQATRYESGQTSGRRTSEASNKTRKGENIHSEGGGPRGGKLEGAKGGGEWEARDPEGRDSPLGQLP